MIDEPEFDAQGFRLYRLTGDRETDLATVADMYQAVECYLASRREVAGLPTAEGAPS